MKFVCVCVCLRTVEFGDWGLVYVRLLPWKWGHLWIWGLTLKSPHFYLTFHRFRGPTSPWQSLVTVPRFEFVRSVCMAFYTIYSAVLRIIHSQYFSKFRLLLNYPMKTRSSMTSFRFRGANLGDTGTKMLKLGSLVNFLFRLFFGDTFGSLTFFCSFLVLTKNNARKRPKIA